MRLVLLYSGLLLAGIATSQALDLDALRPALSTVTMACLAYIMIEVGLEFTLDKRRLGRYGVDYLVAATAAAFPWIFCAWYFVAVLHADWNEALLIGRFAAPTSAGVLFAMLAAAGLAGTWLYRKAQVLAIFDDLDTVLFMIPLQMLFVGLKGELFAVVGIVIALLAASYRWLHALRWPAGVLWRVGYGVAVVAACRGLERAAYVHLEVLLPAFCLGTVLATPHHASAAEGRASTDDHASGSSAASSAGPAAVQRLVDCGIKMLFMFLVGCSLPKISMGSAGVSTIVWHVLALTVLSNLGKCFPAFCYRQEAPLRHRLALSVAMFPRGEVGAGVLLVALGYGLGGLPTTLAALSLALNLLLTGLFITVVIRLLGKPAAA